MNRNPTKFPNHPTRRDFLKTTTAAASAALGSPWLAPASVFGANAPSNRINVGVIGTGNQGANDIKRFMANDDVQIMAVCDVNTASHGYVRPSQFLGREPVQKMANEHYAKKNAAGKFKGVDAYSDFRKIIDRDDIDTVVIVTPDHWHAVMTVMAAKAGKEMVKAVRKYKRILQTGSQWRSHAVVRFACELVRNGRIGQLKTIRTYLPLNNKQGPGPGWEPTPVPEGFDYDMWLGPAPMAPYHKDRCLYRFRFNLDYSGGQITNFGAHAIDIAQCGNGTSLTGPVEIEGLEAEWPPKGSLFTTALTSEFRAKYANGVELTCESSTSGAGARFEGTEGWVHFNWSKLKASPESLLTSTIGPDEIHLPKPTHGAPGHYFADHVRNFLDSVKSRQEPIEPVEIGHRTASICHMGNIALKLMRKLQWDPEKEQFVNDDEANAMLSRPMRGPWKI